MTSFEPDEVMDTEEKFAGSGIGASMRRLEDRRFVTGEGDFVDDLALPTMAFAYVVRSPHGYAKIVKIDKAPASAALGVLCVLRGRTETGAECLISRCRVRDLNSRPTVYKNSPGQRFPRQNRCPEPLPDRAAPGHPAFCPP
jgi:CO/xanthine dehydrogenase Mo-binding subunit